MNVARAHHRMVQISPTELLAVGGSTTGDVFAGATSSAEIFDLRTQTWREVDPVNDHGVEYATQLSWVTVLPNGLVLVAGGDDVDGNLQDGSYVFDPGKETWRKTADQLPLTSGTENKGIDPILLQDGRVFIAGGVGPDGPDMNGLIRMSDRTMIFDPEKESWTVEQPMVHGREKARMTRLPDGRVLVVGGFEYVDLMNGIFQPLTSFEIFDPDKGEWTEYAGAKQVLPVIAWEEGPAALAAIHYFQYDRPLGTGGDGSLGARYSPGLAAMPDGRVLVFGGSEDLVDDSGGWTAELDRRSALIFDPANLDAPWTAPASSRDALDMHYARKDAPVGVTARGAYVIGGNDFPDQRALTDVEVYSWSTGRWSRASPLPRADRQGDPLVDAFGQQITVVGDDFVLSGSVWDYRDQEGPTPITLVFDSHSLLP
jgi:hypothetical protein